MRVQNLALLAVAVVAGLSLTACNGDDVAVGASEAPSATQSQSPTAPGSSAPATGTGTGACRTSQLAFDSYPGTSEGALDVRLRNTGSAACTLKGFPGADLKSKLGTVSAERSERVPRLVTVEPGGATTFTVHYPPNTSGGTGLTFTTLVVTPPNETHSRNLEIGINVAVSESLAPIVVDPVGAAQ